VGHDRVVRGLNAVVTTRFSIGKPTRSDDIFAVADVTAERHHRGQIIEPVFQYESDEITSPPLRLPSPCQTSTLIEFLTN
jgi:hypothetical protein